MSTVATTLCPAILASIATSTELKQTQQKASAMHPDCLRLPHEAHAALSPKLSTTTSSLNGSMKSFEMHGSDIELETVMLHEEISDEMHATAIDNTDNEMDTVSICSDTSELSVGQEHDERQLNLAQQQKQQQQQHLSSFDCSDARSSISTDEPATTPNYPETESPNHEQMRPTLDPFIMANALRIPVPLLPRANNSAFQEEFLRKSQLYAGELMKQQMQLMAAARVNAFTGGNAGGVAAPPTQHFAQLTAISKITQLNAVAAAAAAAAAFKSSTNGTNDALAQLSALSMAQQHTQNAMKTVSNLNRLQLQQSGGGANLGVHHQATTHHTHHIFNSYNNNNNNNNNLLAHETSLKFSIDNILKADFGRRIAAAAAADQKRRSVAASKVAASSPTATATLSSPMCATTNAAIDFSSLMSSASTNFSNTLANICTNSNDSNLSINNNNNNNNKNNNNHEFLKSPRSDHSAISLDNSHLVNDLVKKSDLRTELSDSSSSSNLTTTTSVTTTATTTASQSSGTGASSSGPIVWPAWVYCTRYSDRPSSGRSPRTRKPKKPATEKGNVSPSSGSSSAEDKRPRTAFSGSQLARLKHEFTENRYLTEKRRQQLSSELGLNEAQIKIWFQNKRAKLKKSSGTKNPLALQLMAQGLYNHSTVPLTREEEELQELQEREREAAAAAT